MGGPSPTYQILPWPQGLPESGYKHADLLDAILQQYSEQAAPPNICKLAVLSKQSDAGNTPATRVVGAFIGNVGQEFNQAVIDMVLKHEKLLLLSVAIDGAPKEMHWRYESLIKFLQCGIDWISIMDSFHMAKSLNLAALLGYTLQRYGRGLVDPWLFPETELARVH